MNTIEILIYSIGSVFFLSALAFTYYAIKNSRLMQGPVGHQLMAAGSVLFMAALVVGAVDYFFFPGSGLVYAEFFIWIAGLSYLVSGGVLRAKDIQRTYRVSLSKIFTIMTHSKFYLVAILALVFISTPIFIWSITSPIAPTFQWYDVINMWIWAFAFVCLAVGERVLYRSLGPPIEMVKVEKRLLRSDIRTLRAHLDVTNAFMINVVSTSGMKAAEEYLRRCVEDHPVMLCGYKLELPGKLRAEPLVENLNRINSRERESMIFKTFSDIDSRFVEFYVSVTSTEWARGVVNRVLDNGIKLHGELVHDYALPALMFGNVLEPLLARCKKSALGEVKKNVKTLSKEEPLLKGLEIKDDGRVKLAGFYQALAPMSQKERVKRTMVAFSATLKSSYPIIQGDLGEARTKEMVAHAFSDLLKRRLIRTAEIRKLSKELKLRP